MTAIASQPKSPLRERRKIPPLENGDRLTAPEFERRWAAMPWLKKAELINGIVYIPAEVLRGFHGEFPPLQNGDHLTAAEFERRWESQPNLKRAELINGIVHMAAAAATHDFHGRPLLLVATWLGNYLAATPGVTGGDNGKLRLDMDTHPQADAYLCILHSHGGQSKIDADGYVAGAPELVVEVSASSVSYDSHQKLAVYRRHGVKEYVIWRVYDGEIDWYALRGGQFELAAVGADGIYRSEIFSGLWLDVTAFVAEDFAAALKTAAVGHASPAHAEFVTRLKEEAERRAQGVQR